MWTKITANTLRSEWMYSQSKNTVNPITSRAKIGNSTDGLPFNCWIVPGMKNSGKCQKAQAMPNIKSAVTTFHFLNRRSRAKPRQPNSSETGPPRMIAIVKPIRWSGFIIKGDSTNAPPRAN